MNPRHIPNIISVMRLFMVAPVVAWILGGRPAPALVLFLIAGASDALDGFLAKRYGWQSRVGGFLDGIADKLLLVGSMLALAWMGALPVWLVAAAMARDAIIVTGGVAFRLLVGPFTAEPSRLSKLNTALQIGVVALALTRWLGVAYPDPLVAAVHAACLVLVVASGAGYVVVWGRRAVTELAGRS
ncbi:CDP-alcohol phosphatidyltransferase family protein [Ectothiorhodospiraceae bacterium WFHF3C12]|nr:CDP-alcohol phosphatidyltransferase family protein [Ectothiorhodospiraceae bacterium WFHF3C12]